MRQKYLPVLLHVGNLWDTTKCGAGRIAIGQFWSCDWSAFCHFFQQFVYNNRQPNPNL